MIRCLIVCFACLAAPLGAQDFPAPYYVDGVATDDRLNIRARPGAKADIIGTYGPYDLNIEVLNLSRNGKWARVGLGERNGWVAIRFLKPSDHNDPNGFPRPMICSGVEPFWTLATYPKGDEYDAPDTGRRDLNMLHEAAAPNGYIATWEEGPTLNRTLIVERAACGDGMSDRDFGWRATLFNEAPDGNSVQTGCCTMDTNR